MTSFLVGFAGSFPTHFNAKKKTLKKAASRSLDRLADFARVTNNNTHPSKKARSQASSSSSSSSIRKKRISYPILVPYPSDSSDPKWSSWGVEPRLVGRAAREGGGARHGHDVVAAAGAEEDLEVEFESFGQEEGEGGVTMQPTSRFSVSLSTINATLSESWHSSVAGGGNEFDFQFGMGSTSSYSHHRHSQSFGSSASSHHISSVAVATEVEYEFTLPQYSLSSPAPSYISSFPALPPTPSSSSSSITPDHHLITDLLAENESLALSIERLHLLEIPAPTSPFRIEFPDLPSPSHTHSLRRTKPLRLSRASSNTANGSEELTRDLWMMQSHSEAEEDDDTATFGLEITPDTTVELESNGPEQREKEGWKCLENSVRRSV